MGNPNNYYSIRLKGLNKRAKAIIKFYDNNLVLREYNDFGQPLSICPNGKQGIFCISPDGVWNGWFELGKDVEIVEHDNEKIQTSQSE